MIILLLLQRKIFGSKIRRVIGGLIPKEMHDGMFILDWTFGNVWFYPMQPANASYQTSPQLFISPVGTDGFAPSDIEIGREG